MTLYYLTLDLNTSYQAHLYKRKVCKGRSDDKINIYFIYDRFRLYIYKTSGGLAACYFRTHFHFPRCKQEHFIWLPIKS